MPQRERRDERRCRYPHCLQVCPREYCPHHAIGSWTLETAPDMAEAAIPSSPQIWRSKTLIEWSIHWPDNSESWNDVLFILFIWLTANFWSVWCNQPITQSMDWNKKNSRIISILPVHAGTLKYLGEEKGHSEVQCTSRVKQIIVEIFSVLDTSLPKRKIFSLAFEMMHSKQFRATFLSSQYPFVVHRAWKS